MRVRQCLSNGKVQSAGALYVSLRQEAGLSCITHKKNEAPKVQMPGPGQRHRSVLTGSHSVAQAVLEIAV